MKKITLDHSFTPSPLKQINQDLAELFKEQDPDEAKLFQLVTARDTFIQSYIQNLQEPLKTDFVSAELKVNGALVAYAEQSVKASLKQLSGLVRGRKAIKKYK